MAHNGSEISIGERLTALSKIHATFSLGAPRLSRCAPATMKTSNRPEKEEQSARLRNFANSQLIWRKERDKREINFQCLCLAWSISLWWGMYIFTVIFRDVRMGIEELNS